MFGLISKKKHVLRISEFESRNAELVDKNNQLSNRILKLDADLNDAHAQLKECMDEVAVWQCKFNALMKEKNTVTQALDDEHKKHIELENEIILWQNRFIELTSSSNSVYSNDETQSPEKDVEEYGSTVSVVDGVDIDTDNPEFFRAVELVQNGEPLIYITGKAGTGKSTFLKYIKRILSAEKNIVVVAPTGVAALNVGGMTIHKFFRLPLSIFIPGDQRLRHVAPEDDPDRRTIKDHFKLYDDKIQIINNMDMLIVDEVSMVRCDVLDVVDQIMKYCRKDTRPFGGVQTLLIGDAFQLSPVAMDDDWYVLKEYYKTPYFFSSNVLSNNAFKYIELEKIYRQNEEDFIDLLNSIRVNEITDKDIEQLNFRYQPDFTPDDGAQYIVLTTHNKFVDIYNQAKLDELSTESRCYEAIITGAVPEKQIPAPKKLYLKVGAQVMFVKNSEDRVGRTFFNGKIGTIKALEDNVITVSCENDGDYEVEIHKWDYNTYVWHKERKKIDESSSGQFLQFPLKLAWAITVHKSQGLTFDNVIAYLADSFAPGQVYVALSRCRSFNGLVLKSPISREIIKTDPFVIEFSKNKDQIS